MILLWIIIIKVISVISKESKDIPCKWISNSGSSYDLTYLTRSSNELSYVIIDGDIPCTPETEPSYAYTWNFCQDITSKSIDRACILKHKSGVALQSIYISDDLYDCYVIGNYNPLKDDLYYSQLDLNDPSKGISMRYPSGDRCEIADESGVLLNVSRSATIDVICDNVKEVIIEAQESSTCQYHLVMKSYYGCPTTCAITSNGLCNSHGYCKYDNKKSQAYCYCNEGYFGNDCSQSHTVISSQYNNSTDLLQLLTTLFEVSFFLIAIVSILVYRFIQLRSKNQDESTSNDMEMIETSRLLPRSYNT